VLAALNMRPDHRNVNVCGQGRLESEYRELATALLPITLPVPEPLGDQQMGRAPREMASPLNQVAHYKSAAEVSRYHVS